MTDQTFDERMDLEKVPEAELRRAMQIADGIEITDSNAVVQYGVGAQSKVGNFADMMLEQIRSKDSGHAGEILSDLILKVKDLDVGKLGTGGISKVPIIGSIVSPVRKFLSRYEKVSSQIDRIVSELETARMNLLRDITMLDGLYEKNLEHLRELELYIIAGELKIREIREKVIPGLQAEAETSGDSLAAQRLQDMNQILGRFEKKLHDLKLSRMVSIQTAPQIRLIQNNDQALVEKIQSSILNAIPLWKNQLVIAITLFRQKKALELQRDVTDTTNELLTRNSAMLKDGTVGVARESERGIVDIETLKKVNADLISTLEETLKIQAEGKTKRRAAEEELSRIENELKERLRRMS